MNFSIHEFCVWWIPQGGGIRLSARISAIKHRQDGIDYKVTESLVKSLAIAAAMHKLKTMLNKYMGNEKEGDESSPSVSKSALDNQGAVPLQIL